MKSAWVDRDAEAMVERYAASGVSRDLALRLAILGDVHRLGGTFAVRIRLARLEDGARGGAGPTAATGRTPAFVHAVLSVRVMARGSRGIVLAWKRSEALQPRRRGMERDSRGNTARRRAVGIGR